MTSQRAQRRFVRWRLARLAVQLAVAGLLYLVVAYLPHPTFAPLWIGPVAAAILVIVVIVLTGKVLYDTLFFDHYWRAMDNRP